MTNDFDKALLAKIKKVYKNTQFANTQIAFYQAYDASQDPETKLKFPLVNIYRPNGIEPAESQTMGARFVGVNVFNETLEKLFAVRFTQVKLAYQFDIYANTYESAVEVAEEIIHFLTLDPTLEVIQSNKSGTAMLKEKYSLTWVMGPSDETEFNEGQRLYRYAMAYEIKVARLANFKEITNLEEVGIIMRTSDYITSVDIDIDGGDFAGLGQEVWDGGKFWWE